MVNKTIFCSICKGKPLYFYELHHFELSEADVKKFLCRFAGFDYVANNRNAKFCLNCKENVESAFHLFYRIISQNPNKNLLDLPESILGKILDSFTLRDLKNVSRVCSTFHQLSKEPIENSSKICIGEPQTKAQLLKISNFQRFYRTISIDELQHAPGILKQLQAMEFSQKLFEVDIDIHSDDRVYLISSLRNLSDKFSDLLISINVNFQFEMDEVLYKEILEADVGSFVKSVVYEKKCPKVFVNSLKNFRNIVSLTLDCSEELPDLSDVGLSNLRELNVTGVFSLEAVNKLAGKLKSLRIASQLSQAEILEKILFENKDTLTKLNLCIANFEINEPTKILKLVDPLQNLEELSIRTVLITKGLSEWMESSKYLKKLILHCCDFDNDVSLDFFTQIIDLSWIALNDASQEHFYKSLIFLSSLEHLTLYSFVKIDVKLEEVADLLELRYLFVDNEGFGSLVQNMRAPKLNHFVLHCKEAIIDLKAVTRNIELLAESSDQVEKFQFDAIKIEYSKEDFLAMLEKIFEKFKNLKEFSIKMEFDENFTEFCEKIQEVDSGLESTVVRTWTDSMEDKEVLGQQFNDKIRIEFDYFENKVEFYFPKYFLDDCFYLDSF